MGYFEQVYLDKIDFNNREYIYRTDFNQNDLVDSIDKEGLLHPILLREDGNAGYVILSGYRRALAHKELNKKELYAHIFKNDELADEHFLRISIAENTKRQNLEPIEIANALVKIKDKLALSLKELGEQFGEAFGIGSSAKNIEKYLKLNLLDKNIKEKISTGAIKPDVGFKVAEIDDPEDRSAVASFVSENEKISKANLNDIIENAKKLKIDNELKSYKDIFQNKQFDNVLENTEQPNRLESFIQQLNREADPEKANKNEIIQSNIDRLQDLAKEDSSDFKGKISIKKKNINQPTVNVNLTISSIIDLKAILELLQGQGGKLLEEIINP